MKEKTCKTIVHKGIVIKGEVIVHNLKEFKEAMEKGHKNIIWDDRKTVETLKCPFGHTMINSKIYPRRWHCKVCHRIRGNGYYPMDCTLPFTFYEKAGVLAKHDPFKNPKLRR